MKYLIVKCLVVLALLTLVTMQAHAGDAAIACDLAAHFAGLSAGG